MRDANCTVYLVQCYKHTYHGKAEWCEVADSVWPVKRKNVNHPLFRKLTASGDCWQQTGIHGFLDLQDAVSYMALCAKTCGGRWRVVRRVVRTTEVAYHEASDPKTPMVAHETKLRKPKGGGEMSARTVYKTAKGWMHYPTDLDMAKWLGPWPAKHEPARPL